MSAPAPPASRRRASAEELAAVPLVSWADRRARYGCEAACHHGTIRCYRMHRCRCPDARAAGSGDTMAWRERRRQRLGLPDDRQIVPAVRIHRQIRALQVIGWRMKDQSRQLGRHDTLISHVAGQPAVWRGTQRWFDGLYERLCRRPGPDVDPHGRPGPGTVIARKAGGSGFPPPYAWHGLDMADPDTVPWYYGWDLDPAAVERVLLLARGRAVPVPDLGADDTAAVVGQILMTDPQAAATLHRVLNISGRQATRIAAAGGITRQQAHHLVLRSQPLTPPHQMIKEVVVA